MRTESISLVVLLAVAVLTLGCAGEPPVEPTASSAAEPATSLDETPVFTEIAADVGLNFRHFNGMTGEFYYSEHMGGGVALFDYDNDGDLDLYATQGHLIGPGKQPEDAIFPWTGESAPIDRLYENLLERGELRFRDVTAESGIVADGYSMGVAVGDYDRDGWRDLYVTEWAGGNRLFRNRGDGTFEEVGSEAGVTDERWGIAAAFLDYDRDGWLDLFVGNYIDYSYGTHKECTNDIGMRDYCGPAAYRPVPDVLFRNDGDGTFSDLSGDLGITRDAGSGMGVAVLDYNDDGWLDLYVANDELPNHLWENDSGGGFVDRALLAGAAVNDQGRAEAGMGVDAADLDRDGDEDLFVAHLAQETNTFYRNAGDTTFEDRTTKAGLGLPSWDFTGFGAGFLDYDNDGWLDVFVANGSVKADRIRLAAGEAHPLEQRNQLFRNTGGAQFVDVSASMGESSELEEVSRGAAFGDLDNDGDVDVVVHNNAGPLRLLRNERGADNRWIGVTAIETGPDRDALGAQVEITLTDGSRRVLRIGTEGSYASAHDPRVVFGLGSADLGGEGVGVGVAELSVTWVDGARERWTVVQTTEPGTTELETERYHVVRRGSGEPVGGSR